MKFPKLQRKSSRHSRGGPGHPNPLISLVRTNFLLKISAIGLAVVMWSFVASQKRGESTEIKFSAPLVLKNIPSNLEITSSLNQAVAVLVKVRRDLAKTVNPSRFQVGIDLRNQLPGKFDYGLTEKNILYDNEPAPAGLTVLQIEPATIQLVLEETMVKEVTIKPRFSGDLADGYIMQEIRIEPGTVAVRGPGTLLVKLARVPTRPLDVQDLRSDVEMLVALDLPPLVRLSDTKKNFFKALIKVSDNPSRVLFLDIPVVFENASNVYQASISKLNVHLEGPRAVMEELSNEKLFAVVDLSKFPPGDYRGLTPAVQLPEGAKVLEQWPILDLFVVNRKIGTEGRPKAGGKKPRQRKSRQKS